MNIFWVELPRKYNVRGIYFHLFSRKNENIFKHMHFIYHNGTVKDVDTLDQMYMKKPPQKQLVRLAFDPGFYIAVNNQTNELKTSGWSSVNQMLWDQSQPLIWSGTASNFVFEWEILKIFFDNNNVVPKWILGNYTGDAFDEESGEWTAGLITTVRFEIKNK